jgi:hypothetical protein
MHFGEHPHKKLPPLPPLPGIPVFRLAELLGLEDNRSIVAVKSRIILHGIGANLHGPSAAICRTLLADVAAADADYLPALEATARIVSNAHFRDSKTKRELCLAALHVRKGILNHRKANAMEVITRAFEQLEYEWTANCLFGAGALHDVQRATQSDYSVSVVTLLISLQKQLRDLVFDDELFMILARYCFFWCIGKATKPLLYPYHPLYSVVTEAMLSLASALALHMDDTSRFQALVAEITKVFSSQMTNAENNMPPGAAADWLTPDPNLVSRLIKRGYSECGARRAVGMTHNAGFDAAVQWAVQHSLDEDFDDPILLVRPLRDLRLDKESMESCHTYFTFLKRCREKGNVAYVQSEKSAQSPPECLPDNPRRNSDENDDAWSEDDGFDLDSQEDKGLESVLDLHDPIVQDDAKDAPIGSGWNDHDEIDLDTELDEAHVSQEENGIECALDPHDPTEPDDTKDDPIVGGWDDHDEIDSDDDGSDEVHDLINTNSGLGSNDGRGGWGNDDADLSTIVEVEHETSVEAVTPLKVALTKGDVKFVEEGTIHSVEQDARIQNESIPSNGVEDVQEIDRSAWDDSVDFTDASDSPDVGDSQHQIGETVERSLGAEQPDDHIDAACDLTTDKHEKNSGQTAINDTTTPSTGDSMPCWQNSADTTSTSEPTSISKTNGLLSVTTSLDAISMDKHTEGDLWRPEQSPSPLYILPAPPRSAPLPRSKLLQVGQEAFANARKVRSPSDEERQRLIEQGRAFYKQVKAMSSNDGFLRQEDGSFSYMPSPRSASAPSVTSPANTGQPTEQMNEAEQADPGDDDWGFEV